MSDACNVTPLSDKHTAMLAMHWWAVDKFRAYGVSCHKGQFTTEETESVRDAIAQYQTISELSQEDIEDIVLGKTKRQGFWETITRTVPGRCVASIRAHAHGLYQPYRDRGSWTDIDDQRLLQLVKQNTSWEIIGAGVHRTADACRHRYKRHLIHRDTRRRGLWTPNEEAGLIQAMQTQAERNKKPSNTSDFWKQVLNMLGQTQTPDQCRNKWCDSLSPAVKNTGRVHWHDANSKILINKVTSLNLDTEDDIPWSELIDEGWNRWTAERLRTRWAALKAKAGASAMHCDVVQQLMGRFSIARPSPS